MVNIPRKPKKNAFNWNKINRALYKTKVDINTNTEENPKMTEQTKEKRQRLMLQPLDINKDINENKTRYYH